MALRSGYYGVKKSVLRAIEGLSGAKIIKTIGNGLKLTNAGTLSVDIDTNTMKFINGKLSVESAGGIAYELEKHKVGTINGMSYYTQLIPFYLEGTSAPDWSQSGGAWVNRNFNAGDIDLIIKASVVSENASGDYTMASGTIAFNNSSGVWTLNFGTSYNTYIMIDYAHKEV